MTRHATGCHIRSPPAPTSDAGLATPTPPRYRGSDDHRARPEPYHQARGVVSLFGTLAMAPYLGFGTELDPVYVDVIVARWEAFTEETAVLVGAVDVAPAAALEKLSWKLAVGAARPPGSDAFRANSR